MDRYALIYLFCLFTPLLQADAYLFVRGRCAENQFECQTGLSKEDVSNVNGRGCISAERLCDSIEDCLDKSDEKYCPFNLDLASTQSLVTTLTAAEDMTSSNVIALLATKSSRYQEVPMFAMRVGVKMKQLDSKTYLQAERLINQVLFEAQMGNITYFTHLQYCSEYVLSLI